MFIKKFEQWGTGLNNDFDGTYLLSKDDKYKYIGYNKFNIEDIIDSCTEISKIEISKYISLDTLVRMFPSYKKGNILKDWSTKLYKYKNYIIFVKSGYYYTFIKINKN